MGSAGPDDDVLLAAVLEQRPVGGHLRAGALVADVALELLLLLRAAADDPLLRADDRAGDVLGGGREREEGQEEQEP